MVNKKRFYTNTGRKPLNFVENPMNISFMEEEMYVAFSWYSQGFYDMFESNYGTLILFEANQKVDIQNKENVVDLKESVELVK